jgi:LCP family protein required for cell wall assembly
VPHSRWPRALKVVALLASAIVLLTTSGAYALLRYYTGSLNRIDVFNPGHSSKSDGGAVNYLLVGTDSGQGLTVQQLRQFHLGTGRPALGARSDTMILVHVSKKRDKAVLVSFPRDSYVEIPAYTDARHVHHSPQHNKLNAAYSLGGAKLTIATIEANTGLTINHYVEINVLGLANVVNALGGVNVCVPTAVNDWRSGLDLSAGMHHVDGVTAVAYSRDRHGLTGGSDLGRIKRQQALIGSLFQQATSTGTLLNPLKLRAFLSAAIGAVKVDRGLSRNDLFTLGDKLRHIDGHRVVLMTVPLAAHFASHGLGSTVDWDPVLAPQLFDDIKFDRSVTGPAPAATVTIAPSRVSVQVLNGTGTSGLAHKAANDLTGVGFQIAGAPGTATGPHLATSVIHYGPSRADSARTLAAAVPGATLQADASMGNSVELIVGSNYHGARQVTVATAHPSTPARVQTRTAADNPCA